jgi:two-component system, cell cycle response regulator DivK
MSNTILIIEDNAQNLYLTRFLLEKNGFAVEEALNGRDGIEKALALNPVLVLLDIQLPDISGYTVARELRKSRGFKDVPIIAVTSYAMAGDREKCMEAGCTGYIEKPINPDLFVGEIRKYLKQEVGV